MTDMEYLFSFVLLSNPKKTIIRAKVLNLKVEN